MDMQFNLQNNKTLQPTGKFIKENSTQVRGRTMEHSSVKEWGSSLYLYTQKER